jgi:CO/xanthine dehydrogenase Mo-binding subunit
MVIGPDETVLIRVAKSEMGKGTITGLAQLVAEELDCDWTARALLHCSNFKKTVGYLIATLVNVLT